MPIQLQQNALNHYKHLIGTASMDGAAVLQHGGGHWSLPGPWILLIQWPTFFTSGTPEHDPSLVPSDLLLGGVTH